MKGKEIEELQLIEQNAQQYLAQRQQFQNQLVEIDSALTELELAPDAYRIIGNIMVGANKDDLKKDLSEKKEMLELRIKSLEKQEQKLKEKAVELQKKVLEGLDNEKRPDREGN